MRMTADGTGSTGGTMRSLGLCAGLLGLGLSACSVGESGPAHSTSADTQATTAPSIVTTPFGLASSGCVAEVDPSTVVTVADVPPCPSPIVPAQQSTATSSDAGSGDAAPVGNDATSSEDAASADAASTSNDAGSTGNDAATADDASGTQDAPATENAADSQAPTAAVLPQASVNGWVEYTQWTATETPGTLATTWHVPDLPANDVGQTIFYFPSYEPANGSAIVQPVLQYGVSAAGGGKYWAIGSWWVGKSGARYSSLLQVNPGDTIRGTIKASNCTANGGCKFVIVARDETLDNSRQLTVVESVSYTWTQAAVLEMYKVSDCSQLPTSSVTFSSFVFNDQDGTALSPTWKPTYAVSTRNCPYQVGLASDQSSITLSY